MDRKIIYPGAIPLENDLLETNRFTMIGLAKLASAIMGTTTYLHGLACLPTSPTSMAVTVTAGEIYSLQNVDSTAYSSLPADTAHSILKQGVMMDAMTLPLQAPTTNGLSQNYLIQVAFEESDTENTVLPYYNASNPTQAWHGPNNSGTAQGTVRSGKCVVKAKAGIAVTTGTQTTPGPDAGYVGAYVVAVAAGQTTISAANITVADGAPFLPAGGLVEGIQTGAMNYALDHGRTNAYAASFTPPVKSLVDGMKLIFRATNANTGASTFSPDSLPAAPIYSNTSVALTGGEILAQSQVELSWNSALKAWVLVNTNIAALSKDLVKSVDGNKPDPKTGDVDTMTPLLSSKHTWSAEQDFDGGFKGNQIAIPLDGQTVSLNTLLIKASDPEHIRVYSCKSMGGGDHITDTPTGVHGNFLLRVEALRKANDTDYACMQTLIAYDTNAVYRRLGTVGATAKFTDWKMVATADMMGNYLPLTGGTLTGNLIIHQGGANLRLQSTSNSVLFLENADGTERAAVYSGPNTETSGELRFRAKDTKGNSAGDMVLKSDGSLTVPGNLTAKDVAVSSLTVKISEGLRVGAVTRIAGDGNIWGTVWDSNGDWLWNAVQKRVSQSIPAGAIISWLAENPPAGWLLCNGAGFDRNQFPQLANFFPGGTLPDLRGTFLRGKDNARGVDPYRALGSWQDGQAPASGVGRGEWDQYARRDTGHTISVGTDADHDNPVKQENEVQRETRPVNVAVNFIIRAA
jgi:hypothetical protein